MCQEVREKSEDPLGVTPAFMIHPKLFPMDCPTRKERGWELALPRDAILQFQLPGRTEGCGNRIQGERLYVADTQKLPKCSNKQSTSWWHRNHDTETIIITHVCVYCTRTDERGFSSQDSRAAKKKKKVIPLVFTTFCFRLVFLFFFFATHKVKPNHLQKLS